MMRHALRHSARVNENKCGPMALNQLSKPMIDFLPNFIRHYCFKRRLREFDRQIHLAAMTDIDDFAVRVTRSVNCISADQKARYLFDWLLRRRQTNSLKWIFRQGSQTFDAQCEMRTAPVVYDRVN